MQQLKGFARRFHVDRIVTVLGSDDYPDTALVPLSGPLQLIGGVAIAPACGYDSLAGDTRRISGQ